MNSDGEFRSRKKPPVINLHIPNKNPLNLQNRPPEAGEAPVTGDSMEESEQPLSPAARLFHQPNFNCYIICIMGIGKKVDVEIAKSELQVTLLRHPRFSSIHVADDRNIEKWVRTKVVLENHLKIPDLDPETENPDRFVEEYAADLTQTALDTSKPLWELHILNLKTTESESTVIFRIHHSVGDGASLMSLLLACTRKSSDPESLPTIPKVRNPVPQEGGILPFLVKIWAVFRLVWNTLVDILLFLATTWFWKDSETVLKAKQGVQTRRKLFVHCTLSFEDIKTVKSAMNSTVNDVLLGITAAGLTRYLIRRGENKIEGNRKCRKFPANIRLRATLLVNIRPVPGIQALADMMSKDKADARWGNRLGYLLLPFPLIVPDDPLDYIRNAKVIADRKKRSLEALFTHISGSAIVKTIGIKAASCLSHRVLSNTTMSFSNIVGPVEEISFYGHPITYIAPSVYGHPQALTLHFQSYMNNVKLVLAVDECTIPDPRQLCEDVADCLRSIKDAAVTRR